MLRLTPIITGGLIGGADAYLAQKQDVGHPEYIKQPSTWLELTALLGPALMEIMRVRVAGAEVMDAIMTSGAALTGRKAGLHLVNASSSAYSAHSVPFAVPSGSVAYAGAVQKQPTMKMH